ncbi:hypothetical protein AQJ30_34540 [Streptomyces longwoodensis]|uniref:HXXEE domain-containing protein n=1 Tax=Streptomyces longwoodensis TaxID=68231 RepID=A0A101QNX2_9ACTN|nr:HXXEE domain-containing protein [Streptomyces longwoodensis]KUN33319.1 hypothetical protein AQJ30_34540 [Streptomyces longwoodensis]
MPWAVHDTEELVTVPRWVRTRLPDLREKMPWVPEAVWRQLGSVDAREFTTAVAAMAVVVAAAAADGHRTGGRSVVHQTVLDAFGLHGVVHVAQAAVLRAYTPGSVTSPLVVIPFTLWARARLRRAGTLRPTRARDLTLALTFATAAATGTHALARSLQRTH